MPFMQPQVYETDYIYIDGPFGGEVIPCDVADCDVSQWPAQNGSENDRSIPPDLRDYCENTWAYEIERKHGWVARMSASGYMDATDWSGHASEKAARKYLTDMYGDDGDDE